MIAIKKVLIHKDWIGIELMNFVKFRDRDHKKMIEEKIREIISKTFNIDTKDRKIIFAKLGSRGHIFYKVIE